MTRARMLIRRVSEKVWTEVCLSGQSSSHSYGGFDNIGSAIDYIKRLDDEYRNIRETAVIDVVIEFEKSLNYREFSIIQQRDQRILISDPNGYRDMVRCCETEEETMKRALAAILVRDRILGSRAITMLNTASIMNIPLDREIDAPSNRRAIDTLVKDCLLDNRASNAIPMIESPLSKERFISAIIKAKLLSLPRKD